MVLSNLEEAGLGLCATLLGLRARTSVDAQQCVDQLLGGAVGAVGGRCGHHAVVGPTGIKVLLWSGLCGVRSKQPVRVLVMECGHLNGNGAAWWGL